MSPVKYRRIYRAGTDDVDPDPSFELGSPSSGEGTYGRFAGAVHDSARKSLHSGNRTIQNDRPAVLHERQSLLHGKQAPTDVDVERIVEPFLGNGTEWVAELANTGARK